MQHFLLQEYKKIDTYLTMISDYLKSPVELSAELTVLQMIGIGVAAIAGGAVVVMAGPGVMALGAVEAMKVVAGSAMTGVLAKTLMGEQLVVLCATTQTWRLATVLRAPMTSARAASCFRAMCPAWARCARGVPRG